MRILQQLDRDELLAKLQHVNDEEGYIGWAITHHEFYYVVSIDLSEFKHLVVNSSPTNLEPSRDEYPLIQEVIEQIQNDPAFLEREKPEKRVLDGSKVKHYLDLLKQGGKLKICLIRDKEQSMREDGLYYVTDGAHSLIAYGLWSNLSDEHFPIEFILLTHNPIT